MKGTSVPRFDDLNTMIWCDVSSSEAMVGDSEVKIRIPTTNKVTEQWLHHALFSQLEMMQ